MEKQNIEYILDNKLVKVSYSFEAGLYENKKWLVGPRLTIHEIIFPLFVENKQVHEAFVLQYMGDIESLIYIKEGKT